MAPEYLLDWANLLLRWAHVVVAIAWIGASFYFVFLDNSLVPPADPADAAAGVSGELWAVHGGGFYHPQKYPVAPGALPDKLHWFYWESYATWLTGFALFTVLYLFNASTFLVDKRVFDWPAGWAVAAALGLLVAFWLAYDALCRLCGERAGKVGNDGLVGVLVGLVVLGAAWGTCHLFAGRAAFLITGAMLATAMSANVLVWIIPGQRRVIAQMKAGRPVDPIHGQRARQRSVHNTYFTLPVLVAMLSNHHAGLTQGPNNWLVLGVLMAAGALIRHFFVARHKTSVRGVRPPWGYAAAGTVLLGGLIAWLAPAREPAADAAFSTPAAEAAVTLVQVQAVVEQRCTVCHNAAVQQKNVALHTPELLRRHAQAVYQQAVLTKAMPMNNATGITEAERGLIKRWYESGAAER